jgi:hypothetical protein
MSWPLHLFMHGSLVSLGICIFCMHAFVVSLWALASTVKSKHHEIQHFSAADAEFHNITVLD